MIKKYSKFLLTALFAFFISLTGTSARELTVDELADFVKEIEPDATYVYVIGEYVFTSEHVLTTQDTMLAARSIKTTDNSGDTNSDPIYNEMTIAYLEGVFDSDWNLTGLDYVKNVVGTSPEPKIYDVKYVDYKEIVTKIDVDGLVEKAFKTIEGQGATDKFKLAIEGNTVHVMLNDLEMNSIEAIGGTGIYTAALNFLKEEGIESVTLSLGDEKVTVSTSSIDADEVEKFFKALGNKAGDLVGKDITAKIAFKDGYKTANSDSFTLKFTDIKKIDVDALIEKAYKTIEGQASKDKLITKLNGKTIEVILVDLNMNSVDALGGTGVYTAALNFLKEEGIESVTLVYGDEELEISTSSIDADQVESFLKTIGSKASDLVGKKLTAKIAFKTGYESLNSEEFILDIKEEEKVDVDTLVGEAYNTILGQAAKDKFIIFKDGNKINITLKDLEMNSVDALGGAGVYTAALTFLNEEGIASVTLKLGDEKVTVGDSLDKAEIESFFKALGNKAGDLVGKTMTATVAFEDGYKTANSTEFTINFGKYVDAEALVKKAYNTIKGQVDTDKFVISLNEGLIEIILMDSEMNSIEALAGTGVATAASNLLKEQGVNKVYLVLNDGSQYARLAMDKNTLDKTEAENFFKAIGSKAGDLIGKTLFLTVELEEGYETATPNKFDVVFKDATKVDVDKLVDDAYKTILGQAATDKFTISKKDNTVSVTLKDLEMNSIDAIGGTGIYTAALNFLKENGIKSVTLSLGNEKVEIGDSLDKTEIENFFKALGNKAGDLVGKTMTATVAFEDGYKTANSTEFAINFGKYVDVNKLVKDAYDIIEKQAATDKFVAKLDGNNIEVTIMDLEMNSADALMGTGLATAASNFLKEQGIASVKLTMGGKDFTVGTTIDADELEGFLKQFGSKAGDLINKEMTAEISFKEGFDTLNENKFTVIFEDAIKVDVDNLVAKAYETIKKQAATDKFTIAKEDNTVSVTLKDLEMNSIDALAETGVYTAALNFLKENGVKAVTLSLGDERVEIGKSLDKMAIENFFKALGNKAGDLVGKDITAAVAFEDGYKTANSTEFAINFGKYVDVNKLVRDAYDIIEKQSATDKFVAKLDGNNIEVTIMDLEMNSADALIGTGVSTAITNFLNEQGIASVNLTMGGKDFTVGTTIDADELEEFLKQFGSKAGDLVGKEMTAEISFKDSFETLNEKKFTINFVDSVKVDVDKLVDNAYKTILGQAATDKFLVSMDENIRVVLVDLEMNSIEALTGTGVYTAAANFLNKEGIESITLSLGDEKVEIDSSLNKAEIENFFKALGSKASDLVGKKITAKLAFKNGYKTANSDEFVIELAQMEKVDVNALVKKAYDVIEGQAAKDKFIAALDGTNIEVMLVDLTMNSVDALMGTGVATAATNFLKEEGIESVTLVYGTEKLTISADSIDADEVENFLKKLGNKASDLVGKKLTAKLAFKTGYETANASEFTINIVEEEKVDVNALVDKAYGIVEGQNAKDKILVELDDTNMIVTLIDLNMNSVDALMGTGIGTAITTFLNEEGIEKVTLSYGNASATLSYDHIDADEIETFLKTIGSKASDLVGKKIDVNIDFVEGYKTANSSKFTLDIREEEKVDVASLATSAYNHISSKENDVFEAKLDGTNIEIVLKDLNVSSATALAGSGIGQAAIEFLNEEGVESVCLTYSAHEICFNESNINFTEVQDFFNNLGTTTKDLLNKNIAVGILFEEGYKTGNVNNFMVSFSKYKYNVNFDVDGTKTTEKVAVGDTVSEPTVPTKEGYTFDKWLLNGVEYNFSTPITKEITLTASWTINTYKVKIVANDATFGKVSIAEIDAKYGTEINVSNNSVTVGDKTIVATPSTNNAQYTYTFTGWSDITTPVKNGMTITANFSKTVNKYTVTYTDANSGLLGTQEVEYGTKVSALTAPSKDGYVATNYLYNSNVVDKESTITGDVSYVVEYANAVSVNEVLSEDLENVKSSNYAAKLEDDTVVANFTNPNFDFSELTSVFEILNLLEGLTADERYESVKLSYDNDPAHQVELVGLSMFGAADVARFIGLVTAGQWSGTKGSEADVNKLVASTANKPITVTVALKDGYADTNTASPIVNYDLVFTCE